MAAIDPTIVRFVGSGDGSCIRVTWTDVTENDTFTPCNFPEYADKSIQVFGTFDSASVALHGSNDGGTTYAALNVPAGTAIAITTAGIKAVLENTEWIKPVASSGGATQSLTVAMLLRLGNSMRT